MARRSASPPLEIDGIEPGMHKVGLMLAGHGLLVRVVDTSDGSVGDVSARLNKGGTRTTIKAKGETIYLDGIDLGPDKARLVASRGSYTVKAGDMSGTISVKSGSAQTWVVENGELTELPALTQRPAFWVATGGGAAAAVAATVVAIVVTRPEPQPDGDIVVTMP